MLQICFQTLQKTTRAGLPTKTAPTWLVCDMFSGNVLKWVHRGGHGEGPRTTFSQPFSVLSRMGSPGGPGSPKCSPRVPKRRPNASQGCQNDPPGTAKTHPPGCQNAPPEVPWAASLLEIGPCLLGLRSALKARWRGRRRQLDIYIYIYIYNGFAFIWHV